MVDTPDIRSYASASGWTAEVGGERRVLLGNGFSMAYDATLFGYEALAERATDLNQLSPTVSNLMQVLATHDFEVTMRALEYTMATLTALGRHSSTIADLTKARDELREAIAHSIADLHPDRPNEIQEARYRSVRRFLEPFAGIYTVNYDLLLYWALMQEIEDHGTVYRSRSHDDGFRDSGVDGDPTVLWDIYDPFKQSVYYLHGALHLYVGDDGLRKITWSRTDEALIEQTRAQLRQNRFPLYVAEAGSSSKLDRINRSAYLSRGLRSLSSIGGSMIVYGHSLDANDDHVLEAIVRSKVRRVALSVHGNQATPANLRLTQAASGLAARRAARRGGDRIPLEIQFYDAADVGLWQPAT